MNCTQHQAESADGMGVRKVQEGRTVKVVAAVAAVEERDGEDVGDTLWDARGDGGDDGGGRH